MNLWCSKDSLHQDVLIIYTWKPASIWRSCQHIILVQSHIPLTPYIFITPSSHYNFQYPHIIIHLHHQPQIIVPNVINTYILNITIDTCTQVAPYNTNDPIYSILQTTYIITIWCVLHLIIHQTHQWNPQHSILYHTNTITTKNTTTGYLYNHYMHCNNLHSEAPPHEICYEYNIFIGQINALTTRIFTISAISKPNTGYKTHHIFDEFPLNPCSTIHDPPQTSLKVGFEHYINRSMRSSIPQQI